MINYEGWVKSLKQEIKAIKRKLERLEERVNSYDLMFKKKIKVIEDSIKRCDDS